MCMSKPKAPKAPPPPAPPPSMETVDPEVASMSDRERRRAMSRFGRQGTLLTSALGTPNTSSKTLLGS